MPDQDNVSNEKISLSYGDFDESQGGNDFGIQDTQLLAGKNLQNFLLSDPEDIKPIDDQEVEEKPKQTQNQSQNKKEEKTETSEDKNKTSVKKEDKEDKPDGKQVLENFLFNDGENDTSKKATPNEDAADAPQSAEEDTYNTLAKDLLRLGVFTKNTEDETEESITVKTPEEFLERFSLEKKKGAIGILENFLSQFGDDYKKMFDAVFVNGVPPQDYLQSFAKMETLGNLDLSIEDNQERVVRTYYKNLKWDDNKIESRIQKLKDYGDLEDEAKTYHEVLLNKEKESIAEIERKKVEESQKTKEKESTLRKSYQRILVDKLKTQEIDGIPLTDKEAAATLEYLTDKKYKLASGELLSEFDKDLLELNNPENHELKVKLGLLLRKKLDLTSVKKTTISKKSDALFTLSTKNAKKNSQEKEMKSFFS